MTDAIAIAADLPFRSQVLEFAQHLSRSAPNPSDATTKEFVSQWDAQIDGSAEVPEEQRRTLVRSIVDKVAELRGAIEGVKDTDAEGAHLLLQNLLSSTFDPESEEYRELNTKVVEAVKKAGEGAWQAKRIIRHETASRVMNNTYNILPSSSPLRPTVLLALISLLAFSGDLKTLSLTPLSLTISLSQWSVSPEQKLEFLTSASNIYAGARESQRALELQIVAIEQLQAGKEVVEKAVVYALSDDKRFSVDDVLRVQGVKEKVDGKTAELVKLFEGDALEGVKKGQEWVSANKSWIEGFAVPQFTPDAIVQKLRFIALVSLAAQSADQTLSFADIASTLAIDQTDVELWVIDENLLKARISQPTASIRILSVSAVAARQFGSSEWQLLEKRLKEWKKAVNDVQTAIVDAEAVAAQGPATNRVGNGRQQQGERGPRKDRRDQQSAQGQQGGEAREGSQQEGITA